MSTRVSSKAAETLRQSIIEAQGVEIFAIGKVKDSVIQSVVVVCRGRIDKVNAIFGRAKSGDVVIHNHPSDDLTPSDADMHLAGLFGEAGVGFVIINSGATRSNWVVEPWLLEQQPVTSAQIEEFFHTTLPQSMADFEPRAGQLEMALKVTESFNERKGALIEAGTGTGKSLAYLVPAALFALQNKTTVIVSTYTRALQGQLHKSDIPIVQSALPKLRVSILHGRRNYLCATRLLALKEQLSDDDETDELLSRLDDWRKLRSFASREEVPFEVSQALWERVESDVDLTMRAKCSHYDDCHYYNAMRDASSAHIVVVNHALLLADMHLRSLGARPLLPKYHLLVLDEGHHIKDAAVGIVSSKISGLSVKRAIALLLGTKRRVGPIIRAQQAKAPAERAITGLMHLKENASHHFQSLYPLVESSDGMVRRVKKSDEISAWWQDLILPEITSLVESITQVCLAIDECIEHLEDGEPNDKETYLLKEIKAGQRRLERAAAQGREFLQHDDGTVRWLSNASGGTKGGEVALNAAPIDIAPFLRSNMWGVRLGVVATSATLTVRDSFEHFSRFHGAPLANLNQLIQPSPFDYSTAVLLGLPKDIPPPDSQNYYSTASKVICDAIEATSGGAFILCTSYRAINRFHEALTARFPRLTILAQGTQSRYQMLTEFKKSPNAVLIGTDSFWEGVSVKGMGLRLVIIPRLPFRVPSEPLLEAQYEQIAKHGGDPFNTLSLPNAILKLRQGFGRLIRSKTDKGIVLILDRRLHDRRYGRIMLSALPPARRVVGPSRMVLERVRAFSSQQGDDPQQRQP